MDKSLHSRVERCKLYISGYFSGPPDVKHMSIGKFLSREAAARKVVEHARVWWEHHGETTLHHTVEACLVIAVIVSLWYLVRPWLPIKSAHAVNRNPYVASRISPVHREQRSDIDSLIQAHLFGVAAQTPVNIVADPAFGVSGIAYSSEAGESVAILSLNDKTVIAKKGTVLPDGATVVDVEQDRVAISRNGRVESLMLDLKKAALNARFTPAQFASGGTPASDFTSQGAGINLSQQLSEMAIAPTVIHSAGAAHQPRLVMPHFESLQQLRGRRDMQRFKKVSPPGI